MRVGLSCLVLNVESRRRFPVAMDGIGGRILGSVYSCRVKSESLGEESMSH